MVFTVAYAIERLVSLSDPNGGAAPDPNGGAAPDPNGGAAPDFAPGRRGKLCLYLLGAVREPEADWGLLAELLDPSHDEVVLVFIGPDLEAFTSRGNGRTLPWNPLALNPVVSRHSLGRSHPRRSLRGPLIAIRGILSRSE